MKRPKICAVITEDNIISVKEIQPLVDLFEVRIDLVGENWTRIVKEISKPWIACNRISEEGGKWLDSEPRRIERLLLAIELGASMVDIELQTRNIENVVAAVKKRSACVISSHDFKTTPPLSELKNLLDRQLKAGADACKIVTTANDVRDNWTILDLISQNPAVSIVAFAMGPLGLLSRVLSPLAGGYFTYASIVAGKESAPGQITVKELLKTYQIIGDS
jgi:3-dehydroquinate dehydratase type I